MLAYLYVFKVIWPFKRHRCQTVIRQLPSMSHIGEVIISLALDIIHCAIKTIYFEHQWNKYICNFHVTFNTPLRKCNKNNSYCPSVK